MKNKTRLQIVIVCSTTLMSVTPWAGERQNQSRITGSANISLDVGKINNILTNSAKSQGRVNIGQIKHSNSSGSVNINRIQVGEVLNKLSDTNGMFRHA